jgi:hypothetical protein
MLLQEHLPVQNTDDFNAFRVLPVENYMPSFFHTAQSPGDPFAFSTKRWIAGQEFAAAFNAFNVSIGLRFTPRS